jgi:uncharacterized membrane protein
MALSGAIRFNKSVRGYSQSAGRWASTRSALTNPGVGGVEVKFDSRDVTATAVFAALYVVINFVQSVSIGNPTVYGPIQLRVSDCLIALAAVVGWPVVGGVTLGCFLTNAYYFVSPTDVILGPLANLIAACVVLLLRRHRFLACVMGALPIGLIVGSYLWLYFPPPEVLSFLPVWAGMVGSIASSSIIAIGVIGYTLLSVLSRKEIIEPLKSHGLRVLEEK